MSKAEAEVSFSDFYGARLILKYAVQGARMYEPQTSFPPALVTFDRAGAFYGSFVRGWDGEYLRERRSKRINFKSLTVESSKKESKKEAKKKPEYDMEDKFIQILNSIDIYEVKDSPQPTLILKGREESVVFVPASKDDTFIIEDRMKKRAQKEGKERYISPRKTSSPSRNKMASPNRSDKRDKIASPNRERIASPNRERIASPNRRAEPIQPSRSQSSPYLPLENLQISHKNLSQSSFIEPRTRFVSPEMRRKESPRGFNKEKEYLDYRPRAITTVQHNYKVNVDDQRDRKEPINRAEFLEIEQSLSRASELVKYREKEWPRKGDADRSKKLQKLPSIRVEEEYKRREEFLFDSPVRIREDIDVSNRYIENRKAVPKVDSRKEVSFDTTKDPDEDFEERENFERRESITTPEDEVEIQKVMDTVLSRLRSKRNEEIVVEGERTKDSPIVKSFAQDIEREMNELSIKKRLENQSLYRHSAQLSTGDVQLHLEEEQRKENEKKKKEEAKKANKRTISLPKFMRSLSNIRL